MIDRFYVIRWIFALLQVIGMGMIGGNYGWYIGRMIQFRDHTWEITYAGIAVGLVVGTVLSRLYGVMSDDWDEGDWLLFTGQPAGKKINARRPLKEAVRRLSR